MITLQFYSLSSALDRNGRKKFRKDFYGIDAIELSLNLHDFPWAVFRSTKSGVKIHLTYDINNSLPKYLSAGYIAGMYRAGWNIEIFFKTIKQNLQIKKFFGQTENAVKTQIRIA